MLEVRTRRPRRLTPEELLLLGALECGFLTVVLPACPLRGEGAPQPGQTLCWGPEDTCPCPEPQPVLLWGPGPRREQGRLPGEHPGLVPLGLRDLGRLRLSFLIWKKWSKQELLCTQGLRSRAFPAARLVSTLASAISQADECTWPRGHT